MLIIAHRGAPFLKPENTLAGFLTAVEQGARMIELDVFACKSGELVVFHDHTLERLTDGEGEIEAKTLRELKTLHVRDRKGSLTEEKIPTLREVLEALAESKVALNIELKGPATARPVYELVREYVQKGKWELPRFVVSAFDHNQLVAYRELDKEIKLAALVEELPDLREAEQELALDQMIEAFQPFAINPGDHNVTKAFVEKAHGKQLQVNVWTVIDAARIAELTNEFKVDGIFSDDPAFFRMGMASKATGER